MDEPKEWCPYCYKVKCICREISEMFPNNQEEPDEVEKEKPENDCHD